MTVLLNGSGTIRGLNCFPGAIVDLKDRSSFSASEGKYFKKTLTQDTEFSFGPTAAGNVSFVIELEGDYTVTWPTSVIWEKGLSPKLAWSSLLEFVTRDEGATWFGRVLTNNSDSGNNWIITTSGDNQEFQDVVVDPVGNVYLVGATAEGTGGGLISKHDPAGNLLWQRRVEGVDGGISATSLSLSGATVDVSGNLYVCGRTGSSSNRQIFVAKYLPEGTLVWQRYFGGTSNEYTGVGSMVVDNNNNVYVLGYTTSAGQGAYDVLVLKLDSNGTHVWDLTFGSSVSDYETGIGVDSSNNVYVSYITVSTDSVGDVGVAKFNSDGSIQWQRYFAGSTQEWEGDLAVSPSGNAYFVGITASQGAGMFDTLIAKYDTNGTLQWQRTLGSAGNEYGLGYPSIGIDSSENVYISGHTANYLGVDYSCMLFAKYNSSGTLQWQRVFRTSIMTQSYSIDVDDDNIYVAGYTSQDGGFVNDCLAIKLPTDGSLIGEYGAFTYEPSSLTSATSTLTEDASTLTPVLNNLGSGSLSKSLFANYVSYVPFQTIRVK